MDKILAAVDLDSEKDVFISNSVFRMPTGVGGKTFHKPNNDEIAYYKPYLLRSPSRNVGSPKSLMWKDVQEVRRKYDELDRG